MRFYYLQLACRDIRRLAASAALQALTVAGVCFPILVLLAVKRGHVADLRYHLETSPSGRMIGVYFAAGGRPFQLDELDELIGELGNVDVAYPMTDEGVALVSKNGELVENVELRASSFGDPMLVAEHANVLRRSGDMVLYKSLASSLGARIGDEVGVSIEDAQYRVSFYVRGVVTPSKAGDVGFISSGDIDRIRRFRMGGAVPEWDLPARVGEPAKRYPTYLLINDASDPLSTNDLKKLEYGGYEVRESTSDSERSLGGLIAPAHRDKVNVYRVTRIGSTTRISSRFYADANELMETQATDVAIPWCPPRQFDSSAGKVQLVGLTLPKRSKWLRALLVDSDAYFSHNDSYASWTRNRNAKHKASGRVDLTLMNGLSLPLNELVDNPHRPPPVVSPPQLGEEPIEDVVTQLIVPAKTLAYLDEFDDGLAELEIETGQLIAKAPVPSYEDAVIFGTTIDDVPGIVRNAQKHGFPFEAENARIEEIRSQTRALTRLVGVVAGLVFAFGILTVFAVLWESTARKRNVMGIMRVMGVSRAGAAAIVMIRAFLLGGMAVLITLSVGWLSISLLSWDWSAQEFASLDQDASSTLEFAECKDLLIEVDDFEQHDTNGDSYLQLNEFRSVSLFCNSKPTISARLLTTDAVLVLVGSVVCSFLGAVLPAFSAALLDPFEAVVTGRFR